MWEHETKVNAITSRQIGTESRKLQKWKLLGLSVLLLALSAWPTGLNMGLLINSSAQAADNRPKLEPRRTPQSLLNETYPEDAFRPLRSFAHGEHSQRAGLPQKLRIPLVLRQPMEREVRSRSEPAAAQAQPQPTLSLLEQATVQITPFFLSEGEYLPLRDPGSGVIIHPRGIILSNLHVVSNYGGTGPPSTIGDLLVVFLPKQRGMPPVPAFIAEFLSYPDLDSNGQPDLDLALLRITRVLKQPLKDCQALKEAITKSGERFKEEYSEPLSKDFKLESHLQLGDSEAVRHLARHLRTTCSVGVPILKS